MNIVSKSILTAVITILVASSLFAKVARTSLGDLVKRSELIVVAKVEKISEPLDGKRYATASVAEVWKGVKTNSVEFLASPTWTCDISDAKNGEIAILFLVKSKESRSYQIVHSGRGRLAQQTIGGKTGFQVSLDVQLPKKTPVIFGSEEWFQIVEIGTLRELVKNSEQNKE